MSSWFSDKYQKMIQDHPIFELIKHMQEFSICDLKIAEEDSKIRAQIFDNGKFVFSITPKSRKRSSHD